MHSSGLRAEKLCLLVVDDHALDREALLSLLWIAGGIEAVAVDVDGALRMTRHFMPQVILIDLGANSSPAIGAAGALVDHGVAASLLFLDQEIRPKNVRAALKLGAVGYWTRHASFEQLAVVIRAVAAGERSFCPDVAEYLVKRPRGWQFKPPHRRNT